MDLEAYKKIYDNLVAKAQEDEAIKTQLLSDPITLFKENGIEVPAGVKIFVNEDSANPNQFDLKVETTEDLSDEMLEQVVGGASFAFNPDSPQNPTTCF